MTETSTMANAMALHFVVSPITPVKFTKPISSTRRCRNGLRTVGCASAVICKKGDFDPDLRTVLDLATDSELLELEGILFGRSFFSPLLKSITSGANVDYAMIEEDLEERENFIAVLESRFLFLAADARSTLRGWRPSYRDVLLAVRRKLNIPCSNKLSTGDLEAEIFLYLLQEYSSGEESEFLLSLFELPAQSNSEGTLQLGISQWKVQGLHALKDGAAELRALILKGGSMLTFAKAFQYLASELSGKLFREAANYQIRKELIRKGGQLAAINIESRAALLAAKQGLVGAASRYAGLRSMMTLLGPMVWGTFLADIVIQMMGTDYARILRAIYAFAQIRLNHTYIQPSIRGVRAWDLKEDA